MTSTIDVVVICGKNADLFTPLLIGTMLRTAREPQRLRLLLGVTDCEDRAPLEKLSQQLRVEVVVCQIPPPGTAFTYGSDTHGYSIDYMLGLVANELCMVVDCDVAFLARDWDRLLTDLIAKESVAIVGTEYDSRFPIHYMSFPNAIGCLMKMSIIRRLQISFGANGRGPLDAAGAAAFCLPVGTDVIFDVGYQLPLKIKGAGYEGVPLQLVEPGSPKAQFMTPEMRGSEYHYRGTPLMTHLGRSYTRRPGVDPDAIRWERAVEQRLDRAVKPAPQFVPV